MRLTLRGSDYLRASVAVALIAAILDLKVVVVLSFTLVAAALVSELILKLGSSENIEIEFQRPHVSSFKGEVVTEKIGVLRLANRFLSIEVSSVQGPAGVEASVSEDSLINDEKRVSIAFTPRYSGRFRGFTANLLVKDPLGLCSKKTVVERADFILDSLPASLGYNVRRVQLSSTLGEREGKQHGSGLEFYAVNEYETSMEKKSIFWKKVARMPDARLLVKIRETNVPKSFTIALIQTALRNEDERLRYFDLVCEALGSLGKNILSIGCDVELIYLENGKITLTTAADVLELSAAIMNASTSSVSDYENVSAMLDHSDICILGMKELEDEALALSVFRKPSVLIREQDEFPSRIGELFLPYSGREDLGRLVSAVVGK